ncbi:unnamed protein product [Adineta steineri]|uniref:Uncharacterized protein n=1 Tax=Adineta steineri TaxID=433720 RepID=A0A816GLW5_9BILA|nr:unnamed protein product [Adineta steineri]CAF1676302.1 unnamed protein product [Adineta steineri]
MTSNIIKQFPQQLATYLCERYMAPISYLNIYRAQNEFQIIKSVQRSLRKGKYVLRVTDKGGVFRIGHSKDYEQKAEAYRQKAGAYVELENNPLWIIFDNVEGTRLIPIVSSMHTPTADTSNLRRL